MKRIVLILAILCGFVSVSFAQTTGEYKNISPIVQLISYKDIYGKYVEMLGWGSASIINDKGIIISNNHVVDDGKGNLATAFSVCVTHKEKEKPTCDYTASLISRDDTLDISILKINPLDIYGNKVDYNLFRKIDIDFNYKPNSQDEVVAIGYPWIGADTITQTKGIVSGISEYNGYSYIKTDTIIAGGNSGGGLINKEGKLIGIPTFGIGGFTDPSLGYALTISEAQKFITENIDKIPAIIKTKIDFAQYKSTIDKININQNVKDDLFDVSFTNNYEIKNYIKNRKIEMTPRKNKEITVSSLNVEVLNTPDISTDKSFFFFLEAQGYYNRSYDKLQKANIGGLTFYTPVYMQDASMGNASWNKTYFARLDKNSILIITIAAALYDEKNNQKLKEEMQNVLKGIKFDVKGASKLNFDFDLTIPSISIKKLPNSVANDRYGMYGYVFDKIYNNFSISIFERNLYEGKGQTIEDTYKAETSHINSQDYKSMITLKGHKGYIYCNSSYVVVNDENGNTIEQQNCSMKIYEFTGANNADYYLYVSFNVEKHKAKEYLNVLNGFLSNMVNISPINDGKTILVNIFDNQTKLNFVDIQYQPEGFKNVLKLLVKYKLLKNVQTANLDAPLTWGDYIDMYVRMLYNFDLYKNAGTCNKNIRCVFESFEYEINGKPVKLSTLIDDMGIDLFSYVDKSKVPYFQTYLELKLAGVQAPVFSEYYLTMYSGFNKEKIFENELVKVKSFNNKIFGYKEIGIYELVSNVAKYVSNIKVYYVPGKGIITKQIYSTQKIDFSSNKSKTLNLFDCLGLKESGKILSCIKNYKDEMLGYEVLKKGDAINDIIDIIDFSLFDETLKIKKETIVSEEKDKIDTQDLSQ